MRFLAPVMRSGAAITLVAMALAGGVSVGAGQAASVLPLAVATLVFDGVTVIDVQTGQRLPHQRVVVVGHRIHAVGGAREVPLPSGAQVVEARGKYLIPGLWEMHLHPQPDRRLFYRLLIANGVTGMRDAHSHQEPVDTAVRWWHEILAGRQVGPPRQLLAGPFGDMLSDEEIAERQARGANFLKVYPFQPSLAAAIRHAGLPFGGHVYISTWPGMAPAAAALEASDSGISIIDHANSSGGLDHVCLGQQATVEQCRPIAERFRKNGTWLAPTLIVFGDQLAALGAPAPALAHIRRRLEDFRVAFWTSDTVLRRNRGPATAAPVAPGYLAIAHRVGLPLLAGTDVADISDATTSSLSEWGAPALPGFALHAELEVFVAEGLTPLEALQSATLNPALMLHATDSLGTVAPGKLADLVLLDADPLKDITNTSAIRAVVADGRYYDRVALDQMLADVRAAKKTPSSGRGWP